MLHLHDISAAWASFFHSPEPSASLAIFRIFWGLLLCVNGALMIRDVEPFFGPNGYLAADQHRAVFGKTRFSLFLLLPETISAAWLVLWLNMLGSLLLALGLFTRTSAAVVFLTLVSLHHRNPCVFHSGDTLMRLLTFLLIFSRAGESYSFDAFLAGADMLKTASEGSPWCLRLMQIQLSLVYLRTVYWKLYGKLWPSGTAAYYPTQLESFQRLRLPRQMCALPWIRLATWGTLVVELGFAVLVWFEETRYIILIAGIGMHLIFELFLNLQLFSWTMIVSYLLFVPPREMDRLLSIVFGI